MIHYDFIAHSEYGGWFHVYSFTFLIGWFITLILCWWRFKLRNIPFWTLEISIFIITIPAMLGASFFGKINFVSQIKWYDLFAFWKPGLSVIGGLLIGFCIGWGWFYYCGKKLYISLWVFADLILPNLLLGQAIGRIGNFFNHELLGHTVSYQALHWLPNAIKNNLFKWYLPPNQQDPFFQPTQAISTNGMTGVDPLNHRLVQYYQPLFLFEMIANILWWALLVGVVPWLWQYISCYCWNKKNQKKVRFAHFYHTLYWSVVPHQEQAVHKHQLIHFKKTHQFPRTWSDWKKQHDISLRLNQVHNPHRIIPLRAGVAGSSYFIGYFLIRLILLNQRAPVERFFGMILWVNYLLFTLFILCGMAILLLVQYVLPRYYRRSDWLYEKQY